ncbi:MAG: thioredoxin [Acidimicrobiia bacterium]|nr:thioredoxin [Acidimicrobiia bacterium]
MSENTLTLTAENFDEVLTASETPIVVDFWAEWCGPCKMIAPILDEIAAEQAGKVRIAKLNVDDASEIAMRYGVMSIPTMIKFTDGEVDRRVTGAKAKGQLMEELAI